VLDLADALALSAEQRGRTEALLGEMQAEAGTLGHALLEREAAVERLFASGDADEAGLRAAVGEAARLRGELRYTHLRYHLAMRALLTQAQIALYDRHRGYSGQMHLTPGGHRPH
jgi:Spy/CpxP family protein refolding chaperone